MDTKVKSVKTRKNSILKEFIIEKYGSVAKFISKEKVHRGDVEVTLYQTDIFNEINIGMKVCKALDIDAEELFCRGAIRLTSDVVENRIGETVNPNMSPDEIIREKCSKLGGAEQQKILDYINNILAN